jgi:molecular chaperone GrpE
MNKKSKGSEDIQSELSQAKEQLSRALADYDNLRKRTDRERYELGKIMTASVVSKLLPAYDMLLDAQKHLKDSGVAMIITTFEELIGETDIVKIKADRGTKFDENLHEAVEIVDSKGKHGEIAEEVATGWQFKEGGVVKHSKVKVFK